ncbi:MAG: FHA domain-containing protein, partial [Promethearchaeota archaeon]
KEICENTLKEPDLKDDVKIEVKKILKKVESDISQLKEGVHEETKRDYSRNSRSNLSIGGYAPAPTKEILNSVHAGAFDPLSSPILRNLQKSKITQLKKNVKDVKPKIKEKKETKKKEEIKDKKEKEQIKKPEKKKAIEKSAVKASAANSIVKKEEKESESAQKSTPSKPKPKKEKIALTPAFLEIEQIQLSIPLKFEKSVEMLGRQDFESKNLTMEIPKDFFSPIIERNPNSTEATEHCIIEQIEPRKYFLKDRFNLKKTYFNGKFIDTDGAELKDGDNFILPVLVNEQLSSLTVIFHVEK